MGSHDPLLRSQLFFDIVIDPGYEIALEVSKVGIATNKRVPTTPCEGHETHASFHAPHRVECATCV